MTISDLRRGILGVKNNFKNFREKIVGCLAKFWFNGPETERKFSVAKATLQSQKSISPSAKLRISVSEVEREQQGHQVGSILPSGSVASSSPSSRTQEDICPRASPEESLSDIP